MGFEAVADVVTRAEVGAIAALDAGRTRLLLHLMHAERGHAVQIVVAGEHDEPAAGLGDHRPAHLIGVSHESTHHGSPEHIDRIGHGRATAGVDALSGGRAHRNRQHARPGHLTGDGDHAVGHRMTAHGAAHGIERAHVGNHGAHVFRQPQRRNGAAEQLVHQNVLVPGGIEIVELSQLDARTGDGRFHPSRDVGVFALDRNDAANGAHGRHDGLESGDDLAGVPEHDVLVGVEQRLALAAVGDDRFHLRVVFDVRRETGSTLSDHARLAYPL